LFIGVFRTKSASIVQNYNYSVVIRSISDKICLPFRITTTRLFIGVFRTKSASIVQNYNYSVVIRSISDKICLYRSELQLIGCLSEYFGQNLPLSFRITTTRLFIGVFRTKSVSIVQNYNYSVVYRSISDKICLYRSELQLLRCLSEYFGQNLPLSFRITTT